MKREVALITLKRLTRMESMLNGMLGMCEAMSKSEKVRYQQAIGGFYIGWGQMLVAIIKEHPDLAPAKHKSWLMAVKDEPAPSIPWLLAGGDWLGGVSSRSRKALSRQANGK